MISPPNQTSMYDSANGRVRFQSSNEILALAKSNATPNLFAIGGPKSLQLTRISETDIVLEYDLAMQIGHARSAKFGLISDLKFGHQNYGRNIAASTLSGSIHLYNLDRGNRVRSTFTDHKRAVNSIDFSTVAPYGLVSGSQDGKMKIWDLRMRNTRAAITINGNADAVRCVQFNPHQENILCSIFDSGVIQKWDTRKPDVVERRINAHSGPGLTLDWHPNLDYIVTGGRDKQLQVWNMGSDAEYRREPDHVIYTSGPIYKACWCRGRGNGSIMNTDIATCFLNDDPCIQIWTLNRRFIPRNIIDCHSNQITGLLWKTPRHLISCSKDKGLIQHDVVREPKVIDNLCPYATSWNPVGACNLLFIKQSKDDYDLHNEPVKVSSLFISGLGGSTAGNSNGNGSSSKASPAGLSSIPTSDTLHHSLQSAVSLASYINNAAEKKIGRNHLALRNKSFVTPQSKHIVNLQVSPFVMPVDVVLVRNESQVFEFLSASYLIEVPDGLDITQVCEYNAALAASAGRFRDCQTWRTLRFGILWQYTDDTESADALFKSSLGEVSSPKETVAKGYTSDTHSTINASQSDKFGTSLGSYTEGSVASTGNGNSKEKQNGDQVKSEQAIVESIPSSIADSNENVIVDDEEETVTFDGQQSIHPVAIRRSSKQLSNFSRNRYSFNGSSVDMDNEKSFSPRSSMSLSRSPVISRLLKFSGLKTEDIEGGSDNMVEAIVSRKASSDALQRGGSGNKKSQLTAILRKSSISTNGPLTVPWNPTDLIRQAANYSAKQGDLITCATFALLFKQLYPKSMSDNQAQEWIWTYHDMLLRRCLFGTAAAVMKRASEFYDVFKTVGQTRTSVRLFCNSCHSLVLNENSKIRATNADSGVEFGFWYCEKCSKRQGNCTYCDEPIKGICVVLLGCGHKGHFGCFRSWFVEEKQTDCPICWLPAVVLST
ncbi:hypothetical protein FOA43_003373 [Brettanomyces nanus]|uniref:Restriction of telomere capping protein 1 n=1 Tax=Eeniella nana TaxID=13502 RepID=A0A875RW22_EENNA|nr:uncharacterized protein FOA43_003373 [Brettanomyces nanus]QPG75987.1 hypothetical protein FOA43_003373 [Brettanomyces nanus]